MDLKKIEISRRNMLKGLAAVPVVAIAGYSAAASAEMLKPDDAVAVALGYVEKSATDGQTCANCNLYQGGSAATGGCPIFAGKEVAAAAWCKSWVAKP
jgi:hypothetical protein